MPRFIFPAVLVLLLSFAAAAPAIAAPFVVVPGAPSRVEFQSKAPTETFTGKTNQVSGIVDIDPAAIADAIAVTIEVDMASFDTGIALRNRHMTENHLHTEKHPKSVFTGGKLSDLSGRDLSNGKRVTGTIEGELELHGVKKPISARLELWLDGDRLRTVARFSVVLADFGIPRPQFLMMKLGEKQLVTVDLVAKPK